MLKIGLKLWSINIDLIDQALKLFNKERFHYIELYVVPGSFDVISKWKSIEIPYIIHAPHSFHGFNLAQKEKRQGNERKFIETKKFADELGSSFIITHGGNNGLFDETLRQLGQLNDSRILLENKPKIGLAGEECVGYLPEDFQKASEMVNTGGMALDFVHAVCAANSTGKDPVVFIDSFLEMKPKLFHLSDADINSTKDSHLNLGRGSLPLGELIKKIPKGSCLTLETPRDAANGLKDFVDDVGYLRELFSRI